MQIETKKFTFKLLTPCFSGTALGKYGCWAEMRVPPIRGHIRFWHRVLFGVQNDKEVWGYASKDTQLASKIAIKLLIKDWGPFNHQAPILPHKGKGCGIGYAIPEGEKFTFELQRLVGCDDKKWESAQKAVKLWLLLGGLGLRSNRAAGSVWPVDGEWIPKKKEELTKCLHELGLQNYSVALIGVESLETKKNGEKLRAIASDTIRDRPPAHIFGSIKPRKPSPVKFKVIELDDRLCLLACAKKEMVLGSDKQRKTILEEAKNLLLKKWAGVNWEWVFT